jgi:diadenylate cyclase
MAEKIQETFYALWNLFERYVLGVVLEMQLVDFIDIIILTIIIFSVYKFIRERRAVRLLRGLMIVIAVLLISVLFDLKALKFILENFYQVGMIAILII